MTDDIKLLEELVVEAVDRLRKLSRERDGLREEVGELRERLDTQKREASSGRSEDEQAGVVARRAQAVEALRDALSELRGEGTVV